jgi:FkbM family methyltransferase
MYREFYESLLNQVGGSWFDFEGLIRDIYVALLRPGDVCVDAGANRGDHTFQMAQAVAPNGRVIAIEAAPPLVDEISKLGRKGYPRLWPLIDLYGVGLSDHPGRATFFFAAETPGLSGLRNRPAIVPGPVTEFQVNLLPLDEIRKTVARPIRFMKVDLEGGEYDALRGAQSVLREDRPVLVFEHDAESPHHFSYTIHDLVQLFRSLHYGLFDFFGNSYNEPAAWRETVVWNFLALPDDYPQSKDIFKVVRNTLTRIGVQCDVPGTPQ